MPVMVRAGTPAQTSVLERREGQKKGDPGPLIGAPRTTAQRGAEPPQDQGSPEHAAAFRLRGASGSLAQVPEVSHPNHTRDWGGFIIAGPSRPRLTWLGVPGIFTWE